MNIQVCGYCIQELEKQHAGLKQQLQAAVAAKGDVLSHGTCVNHMIENFRAAGFPEDKIQQSVQKLAGHQAPPDLRQHPEILQQYLQGQQQAVAESLKERLQKLANIVKEIKNHASSSCH